MGLRIVRVKIRCGSRFADRFCDFLLLRKIFSHLNMFECRDGPKCELALIDVYSPINCRCGRNRYKLSVRVFPARYVCARQYAIAYQQRTRYFRIFAEAHGIEPRP